MSATYLQHPGKHGLFQTLTTSVKWDNVSLRKMINIQRIDYTKISFDTIL